MAECSAEGTSVALEAFAARGHEVASMAVQEAGAWGAGKREKAQRVVLTAEAARAAVAKEPRAQQSRLRLT